MAGGFECCEGAFLSLLDIYGRLLRSVCDIFSLCIGFAAFLRFPAPLDQASTTALPIYDSSSSHSIPTTLNSLASEPPLFGLHPAYLAPCVYLIVLLSSIRPHVNEPVFQVPANGDKGTPAAGSPGKDDADAKAAKDTAAAIAAATATGGEVKTFEGESTADMDAQGEKDVDAHGEADVDAPGEVEAEVKGVEEGTAKIDLNGEFRFVLRRVVLFVPPLPPPRFPRHLPLRRPTSHPSPIPSSSLPFAFFFIRCPYLLWLRHVLTIYRCALSLIQEPKPLKLTLLPPRTRPPLKRLGTSRWPTRKLSRTLFRGTLVSATLSTPIHGRRRTLADISLGIWFVRR